MSRKRYILARADFDPDRHAPLCASDLSTWEMVSVLTLEQRAAVGVVTRRTDRVELVRRLQHQGMLKRVQVRAGRSG